MASNATIPTIESEHTVVLSQGSLENDAGAVLLEAAMVLGFFLISLLVGCDLLRISYTYLAAQHAVQTTTQWAALGEDTDSASRVASIKQELARVGVRFGLEFASDHMWICESTDSLYCVNQSAGMPRTDFSITAKYPVHLMLLNQEVNLEFQAYGRNERI